MRPVGDQVDLERPVGGGADRGTYRRTRASPGAGHRSRVGGGHTEELEKPDGLGERAFSIGLLRILKGRHRVSHFGGNLFRGEQRGHSFDHLSLSRVLHPQPDAIRGDHRRGERGEPVGGLGDGDCRDRPPGKKSADKARGGAGRARCRPRRRCAPRSRPPARRRRHRHLRRWQPGAAARSGP